MLIPAEDFDRRPGNRVAPDVRDERQFFSRRLAVAALTLAAALVLIVPWQGGSARINRHLPPATGALNYSEGAFRLLQHGDWWRLEPDYSYAEVFHWAFLHPHSERLISTYGPWGFLLIGFSAATFWWVIAAWIFLVFVWSSLLWSLGERYLPPLALLFWMLATSVVLVPIPREELLLLLPVAFLLTYFSCAEGAAKYCLIAGGAAMALGALIKSSSLVISVLVVAVVTADDLLRRRRVPSAAISFTLSLLFFWLLAGTSARRASDVLPDDGVGDHRVRRCGFASRGGLVLSTGSVRADGRSNSGGRGHRGVAGGKAAVDVPDVRGWVQRSFRSSRPAACATTSIMTVRRLRLPP